LYAELVSLLRIGRDNNTCFPMLLKPSWSFFNKKGNKGNKLCIQGKKAKAQSMLLKPSWSFFNKKGNKRRIQKKGQHLLLSLPMRRRETGNTFRIQKKGRDNNKYQIVDLIEPSQQIFDLIPFVILCADCIPSAHTAVVIPSYAEKG